MNDRDQGKKRTHFLLVDLLGRMELALFAEPVFQTLTSPDSKRIVASSMRRFSELLEYQSKIKKILVYGYQPDPHSHRPTSLIHR